jgi:hypothetical protein
MAAIRGTGQRLLADSEFHTRMAVNFAKLPELRRRKADSP